MRWVGTDTATDLISNDATLKEFCKLTGTGTTYDAVLNTFIKAASERIEQRVGYPLRFQAVTVHFNTTDLRVIRLPKNINTITTYYYQDGDEYVQQTFTNIIRDNYKHYTELMSSEIKENTQYKIVCTATLNASETLKNACRMLVAEMFEKRENTQLKVNGGITNYGDWLDIYLSGEIAHNL